MILLSIAWNEEEDVGAEQSDVSQYWDLGGSSLHDEVFLMRRCVDDAFCHALVGSDDQLAHKAMSKCSVDIDIEDDCSRFG